MKFIKYAYLVLHYIATMLIGFNVGRLAFEGVTESTIVALSVMVIMYILTGCIYLDLRKKYATIHIYTLQDKKPDDFPEEIWEQLTLFEQMLNAEDEESDEDAEDN